MLTLPAWDCLPYDRASPALRVMAERLATLHALQAPRKGPQLLVATANAATQRVLTPFRIRQLTRRLAEGERIERDALVDAARRQRLPAHRRGPRRRRIRGARVDRRPVPGGRERRRCGSISSATRSRRCGASTPPTSARTGTADALHADARVARRCSTRRAIKRFRARYREQFGANATGDPLYQAVSDGRRLAGMEHWLPLFEEKLATLFDHLGEHDVIVRDGGTDGALEARSRGDRGLFRQSRTGDGRRAGQLSPAGARRRSISRKKEWRGGDRRAADPPRHALPRAGQRQGDRLRRRRAARFRARARAERQCLRSGRQARRQAAEATRRRSCWRATRPARASGLPACSTTMA